MLFSFLSKTFQDKTFETFIQRITENLRFGKLIKCVLTKQLARWGVAEWIERPLLMLEVRGSNPGHSASKKYHFFTPKP